MASSVRIADASGFEGWAERLLAPETEDQLRDILAEAVRTQTPVTVLGSRTGLTGSCVPQGGWAISLE
ncbi:MAG TPA: FAD-binding protein, partial [Acidobacteriaceae bacterium]|nr:FAD-binding protein [Acidobacteriaceae bacterium]